MFVHNIKLQDTYLSNPACTSAFSAGIICFSIAPVTGNVYILLGLENQQKMFCDFGGGINPSESVEGAAAREFSEESLCVINMNDPVSFEKYEASIKKMLLQQNYFAKIEILQNTFANVDLIRVYYLKQIPWQPAVVKTFQKVKAQILDHEIDHPSISIVDGVKTIDVHWLEKQKMKFWSVDRLRDVLKNNGKYKQHRFRKNFMPVLAIVLKYLELAS